MNAFTERALSSRALTEKNSKGDTIDTIGSAALYLISCLP